MYRLCFSFLLGFALLAFPAQGQDDLGAALEAVGGQYAKGYTQPVTDALGANLNAGLFRTAEVGDEGVIPVIDVYVGVAAMGALTRGSSRSFAPQDETVTTEGGRTLQIDYEPDRVPTALGEETSPGEAIISDQNPTTPNETATLPRGLLNTSIAPLAVPQVGVGTVFGTDAQARYLPETTIRGYASVSLIGLSVRHSLSQHVPDAPLNVAVQGTWQSLALSGSGESRNAGEILDASGWALSAQASKDIPVLPITFYGGVQYEQFGVEVNYTFKANGETSTISFAQGATGNVRALAGARVTLALIELNVDYALGSVNTVSAGVGLAL